MKFQEARSRARNYLGLAPDMTAFTGTFDPVGTIETGSDVNSALTQAALGQQAALGDGILNANKIEKVGRYQADLDAAKIMAQANAQQSNGMSNLISGVAQGFAGGYSGGGGGGFTSNFNYGLTSDVSGFSAGDYLAMGGNNLDASILSGGGALSEWTTDMPI